MWKLYKILVLGALFGVLSVFALDKTASAIHSQSESFHVFDMVMLDPEDVEMVSDDVPPETFSVLRHLAKSGEPVPWIRVAMLIAPPIIASKPRNGTKHLHKTFDSKPYMSLVDFFDEIDQGSSHRRLERRRQLRHTKSSRLLSKETDTFSFPNSASAKVFLVYGSSMSVCSGTIVGDSTLSTAAHCVYDGGWADAIYVVPGMTDVESPIDVAGDPSNFDSGNWFLDRPFGMAKATTFGAWNGYTVNGNVEDDFAWVKLDRPIGIRTGSFGYRSSSTLPTNVDILSYPAAPPYDGRFQYSRSGLVVSGPVSGYSTGDYILATDLETWGGDSGGGLHEYISGDPYLRGSLWGGEGTDSVFMRYTSFEVDKLDEQNDLATHRNAPDIIEHLCPSCSKSVFLSGSTLSTSYSLYNVGFSTSGTITVQVWASTNLVLSSADSFLGEITLAALEADTFETKTTSVTMPTSLPTGVYYIFVKWSTFLPEYDTDINFLLTGSVSYTGVGPSASPTPSASPSASTEAVTKDTTSTEDSSVGIAVGAAIGGVVILAIVIGILMYLSRRSRQNRRQPHQPPSQPPQQPPRPISAPEKPQVYAQNPLREVPL